MEAPRASNKRWPGSIGVPQTGVILIAWLAMWLLTGNAPILVHWTPAAIVLTILFSLATRNLYCIAGALVCVNLAYRWSYQVSHWHDMAWGQLYSISSLIAGHNFYAASREVGMSLANYLPMGNLYGGLLIGIGVHQYWNVWHLLVIAMLLVPFVLRPSVPSLLLFVFTATYYPFSDYTTGGGNVEICYAATIAAIALFRAGRLDSSLVLFAFAVMLRQPSVMLVPFAGLLLWKARDYRRLLLFALLLTLFGGIYIVLDPRDAYEALYGVWAPYAQQWYNAYGGLQGNFSLSTLLALFGVNVNVAWMRMSGVYLPVTLAMIGVLFACAWRSTKRDTVLALGVFATIFVYLFSRGYAQYHYILGTAMPLAVFFAPAARRSLPAARWLSAGLCYVLLWFAVTPLAIFLAGKAVSVYEASLSQQPEIPIVSSIATTTPMHAGNGLPGYQHAFTMAETAEFELARPAFISEIQITGQQVPVQVVRDVPILYATENQMRGAVMEGDIEGSVDGQRFFEIKHFRTSESYSVYPVSVRFPATSVPVRFVRLHPVAAYDHHPQWIIGKVSIRGR